MHAFKPYFKNFNASVALVTAFLLFSSGSSGISIAYTDTELSNGVKNFRSLLTMASALALSLFIIKGLYDTNNQSQNLHKKVKDLTSKKGKPEELKDKEQDIGTLNSTLFLGHSGIRLSGLACTINIVAAGTSIKFNQTSDTKYINPNWLLTVLVITNLASLVGFVLLNLLTIRNTQMSEFKQSLEENIEKDKNKALAAKVENLEKRIKELEEASFSSPTVARNSSTSSLSFRESGAAGTGIQETPAINSPEGTGPFLEIIKENIQTTGTSASMPKLSSGE